MRESTVSQEGLLICTLGTWAIIPEILGFLEPERFRIFPEDYVVECAEERNIPETCLNNIWVIATDGNHESVDRLTEWWQRSGISDKEFKIIEVEETGQLSNIGENEHIAETIFRALFHARRLCDKKRMRLFLSLAGGRKTMSSLLQRAGTLFGTDGIFHVISSREAEQGTMGFDFLIPMPVEIAQGFTPVYLGREDGREGIDDGLVIDDYPLISSTEIKDRLCIEGRSLYREIEEKIKESHKIAANFNFELIEKGYRENFKSLYRLSRKEIEELRNRFIGISPEDEESDLVWLKSLPKAELHCHLGGVARGEEILEIARANIQYIEPYRDRLVRIFTEHKGIIRDESLSEDRRLALLKGAYNRSKKEYREIPEYIHTSYLLLLLEENHKLLDSLTAPVDIPMGIEKYEELGDLQGSKLLQTKEAIISACMILYRKAVEDNVKYMEVRCSPLNYTKGGLSKDEVAEAVRKGFQEAQETFSSYYCQVELILIGSRHRREEEIRKHIDLAIKLIDKKYDSIRIVGFDIAGNENAMSPKELREMFLPLFKRCIHITIHAGETEEVDNIWEAVYHLNADRIGHGLKLLDNSELMERLRDREIPVEMCPTSNYQIIGYKDLWGKETDAWRLYPLKKYLENYIPVTINTDNPGISRTTLSKEYLKVCRMTEGGLSMWDILSIIRCGFRSAFLSFNEKRRLLLEVDKEAYTILQSNLPGR
ncbi:MAG: CRISPR-associated ring nuclease [Nitrospirota bacterium]